MKYDVIVIGGGASGMIAAVKAAERERKVLLLEKSQSLGRKILASGNGRCNLMNTGSLRYYGDPVFAERVIGRCGKKELNAFFNYYGLFLSEESEGRVYPATFQSATVVSALRKALKISGAEVRTGNGVISVRKRDEGFEIFTDAHTSISSDTLLICCGGAAQPNLGGTDTGYSLLSSLGHRINTVFPALVPVKTDRKSISGLSGIRAHCGVSLYAPSGSLLHQTSGEILFTDYGISGICIMQCARFIQEAGAYFEIDFLSPFSGLNVDTLIDELKRRKKVFSCFSPVALLDGMVTDRIAYAVLKQAGIPLRGETSGETGDEQLARIAERIRHYRICADGTRGMEYAQVSAGGADCSQFDPSTMESLLVPGLFAAGEVLNVDGDCGGYNLMFAFASGMIAGLNC